MKVTQVILLTIAVYFVVGSRATFGAERTTWLMADMICRIPKLVCNKDNCDHDGLGKVDVAPMLPGTPRILKQAPDYVNNGYWHFVVNTIKCEGTNKSGPMGSLRIHTTCSGGTRAYYNVVQLGNIVFTEGKATVVSVKFDRWREMQGKYEDYMAESAWNCPVAKWAIGPAQTGLFPATPVTFRARVFITLDENFVPPQNPNDPVGIQPGATTAVGNQVLTVYRSPSQNAPALIFMLSSFDRGQKSLTAYDLQGHRIAGQSAASNAVTPYVLINPRAVLPDR